MEFKDFGLEQGIMEALDILGYHKPFAVQEAVIPHLLAKQDVIVQPQVLRFRSYSSLFGMKSCHNP